MHFIWTTVENNTTYYNIEQINTLQYHTVKERSNENIRVKVKLMNKTTETKTLEGSKREYC